MPNPVACDKTTLVQDWMGALAVDGPTSDKNFRDGLDRLLQKEFCSRASQRSIGILLEVLKERCHTPDTVRMLLDGIEDHMKSAAQRACQRKIAPWYALDAALKLYRRNEAMNAVFTQRLPELLEKYLPFRDSGKQTTAEAERDRFLQMFSTWNHVVPASVFSQIESMIGAVPVRASHHS